MLSPWHWNHLGVPRVNTPPPLSSAISTDSQEKVVPRPKPLSLATNLSQTMEDQGQPWTRSPTKADMEPNVPKWQFILSGHFHVGNSLILSCQGQLICIFEFEASYVHTYCLSHYDLYYC